MSDDFKTADPQLSRALGEYVEFFNPPNTIKAKVGSGGLPDSVLDKAQKLMESYVKDYPPVAMLDLMKLNEAVTEIMNNRSLPVEARKKIRLAAMDLKSNGAMFDYPLVSRMAAGLLEFTESVKRLDRAALEIIAGHYDAMKAVIDNRQSGEINKHGEALVMALRLAIDRYYKKQEEEDAE